MSLRLWCWPCGVSLAQVLCPAAGAAEAAARVAGIDDATWHEMRARGRIDVAMYERHHGAHPRQLRTPTRDNWRDGPAAALGWPRGRSYA